MTHLNANLTAVQEVPPVSSTASGLATFSYVPATHLLFYRLEQTGLANITAASIHTGTIGTNGTAVYGLCSGAGLPSCDKLQTIGVVTGVVTLTAPYEQALFNGRLYVNIRTQARSSGEIRGQILYPPTATTDVNGVAWLRMSSGVPGTQRVVGQVITSQTVGNTVIATVSVGFTGMTARMFLPVIRR
jgi:hypothetical protein